MTADIEDIKTKKGWEPDWLFANEKPPPKPNAPAAPRATSGGPHPELSAEVAATFPAASCEPESCPWRAILADWPVGWRKRWGELANRLQDGGLTWHEAEKQAFAEVSADEGQ